MLPNCKLSKLAEHTFLGNNVDAEKVEIFAYRIAQLLRNDGYMDCELFNWEYKKTTGLSISSLKSKVMLVITPENAKPVHILLNNSADYTSGRTTFKLATTHYWKSDDEKTLLQLVTLPNEIKYVNCRLCSGRRFREALTDDLESIKIIPCEYCNSKGNGV